MKIVGVAVARTGADLNEPIPLTVTNDLSSFGFFQRQVRVVFEMADGNCGCVDADNCCHLIFLSLTVNVPTAFATAGRASRKCSSS